MMRNNYVFLPRLGEQRQLFNILFTEPWKDNLEVPCRVGHSSSPVQFKDSYFHLLVGDVLSCLSAKIARTYFGRSYQEYQPNIRRGGK